MLGDEYKTNIKMILATDRIEERILKDLFKKFEEVSSSAVINCMPAEQNEKYSYNIMVRTDMPEEVVAGIRQVEGVLAAEIVS